MTFRVVEKPGFSVIGLEGSTAAGPGFIQRLWAEANARFAEVAPLALRDAAGRLAGCWGLMSDPTRRFLPWEENFTRGLYLAGVICREDARPPRGWTRWTLPGFTFLATPYEPGVDTTARMLEELKSRGLTLRWAMQDAIDPATGVTWLMAPIRRLAEAPRSDWFTVEQLEADTWVISEYRHWEETHCYLLCGREAAALIDTGLGVEDILPVVRQLTGLPVQVLTTHVHWDHIGSHGSFADVAVHEAERAWLAERFPVPLAQVRRDLTRPPCDLPEGFDAAGYTVFRGEPTRLLRDGDRIDLGGRVLTVLHTPGHSPGHCCFWEEARATLYSGDLIYRGCLYAFYPSTDPALFAQSVARVAALPVKQLRPGHHSLDVGPELIECANAAFVDVARQGKLYQGAGIFDYGEVQLHL